MSESIIEEVAQTELYKKLISKDNIYLSIYSLESYVFNPELLEDNDQELLSRLQDKFDFKLLNSVIEEVTRRIDKLIHSHDDFIEAKVYFNPKKENNGEVQFRPLHTAGIIDQIALVSMLNILMYEFDEAGDKMVLSNISRLIPSNFYGNKVSLRPEELFKPWKRQYKKYTQLANELFENNYQSQEYKYEVELDLENFFPSVNPRILFNYMYDLMPVTYSGAELKLIRVVLIKLLVCKIQNIADESYDLYYGKGCKDTLQKKFCVGIAQGL